MVSALPMNGKLFKIEGGNEQLPQRLLWGAKVHLKYGWSIEEVRLSEGGRFELHAKRSRHRSTPSEQLAWQQEVVGPYEAVVLATPLEHSGINFRGMAVKSIPKRTYQKIVTNYIAGRLRASYFGTTQLPTDLLLTTGHAATPFSVISPIRRLPDGRTLYKLFSDDRLSSSLRHEMFDNVTEVDYREWYAYPHLAPLEADTPFQLAPGLFYNNAIESAASAMEMSAIAAKNSALLVARHLAGTSEGSVLLRS